ncbi:Acetate kinase [Pedobacter cryoconitis]|uniref:Acetate kinase n=1 Tax=Pedobacter cryoconitis TaxID=188932 RepID=A0A127V973_9SPHI|nr:acetate/propionate family kinase [Pedobacter cryoconitis]AMP97548.1 Acetate kinase [Pedobacter cryoconitis]
MKSKLSSYILCLNSGSSSLKFSLYDPVSRQMEIAGVINAIGTLNGWFKVSDSRGTLLKNEAGLFKDMHTAVESLTKWLDEHQSKYPLTAIGHRVVQGGPDHRAPEMLTEQLLKTLKQFIFLAPNHLPEELAIIHIFLEKFRNLPQVVCFDTFFHRDMPFCGHHYPLSSKYTSKDLIRYGFHGLSYEYIMLRLKAKHIPIKSKKIIIAHLGNGASLVAVKNGCSIDTTMGVSPIGGLVMSTRSGDLDPGAILFLLKHNKLSVDELDNLLSKESGLKAIAGTGDVRELLEVGHTNATAAKALALFCYTVRKQIGALTAAMGGLDILVFTGGIGENLAVIRSRICKDLAFFGIALDSRLNLCNREVISSEKSRVLVHVIKTNEELVIARHTQNMVQLK